MNHTKSINSLFRVISVLAVCLLGASASSSQSSAFSVLKGNVADIRGASIPNATVILSNETTIYKTTTLQNGDYSFSISAGVYAVKVEARSMGFTTTYRSEIKLGPNSTKQLDLTLYAKMPMPKPQKSVSVEPTDHPPVRLSSFTYEEIPNLSQGEIRNCMVRFAWKLEAESFVVYKPSLLDSELGRAGVTLSYDLFTITADEIKINSRTNEIIALGNITIENENDTAKHTGTIRLTIRDGKVSYEKD